MDYYRQIDTFRFFAAFSVLTAHWLHFIPLVSGSYLGFIGVDFFFIISGFLISYQLISLKKSVTKKDISFGKAVKNFILRRAFRIFPLYYLILILATVFNDNEIRDAFVYNVFYMSNFYFIEVQHWNNIFSHFWSLSVEEHFYIFWPFLLLLTKQKLLPTLMISIGLFSLCFRYFIFVDSYDYFSVHIHTLACLDLFMFGAGLAYFLYNYKEKFYQFFTSKITKAIILLGLAITYYLLVFTGENRIFDWVFFRTIFGIFCTGLVGLLVIGFKGITGKIFDHKWLVKLGKLSYAIYLIHNFIPGLLLEIKKLYLPTAVEFTIYFITTVVISLLLHRFVETPIRKWGKRYKIEKAAPK